VLFIKVKTKFTYLFSWGTFWYSFYSIHTDNYKKKILKKENGVNVTKINRVFHAFDSFKRKLFLVFIYISISLVINTIIHKQTFRHSLIGIIYTKHFQLMKYHCWWYFLSWYTLRLVPIEPVKFNLLSLFLKMLGCDLKNRVVLINNLIYIDGNK
jgi:hypothetical protein